MYSSEQQWRAQSVSNMFPAAGETRAPAQRTASGPWGSRQGRMGWMGRVGDERWVERRRGQRP